MEKQRRKSQRRGRKERIREEKSQIEGKTMQVREKVGKPRDTVCIQWFVAPEVDK